MLVRAGSRFKRFDDVAFDPGLIPHVVELNNPDRVHLIVMFEGKLIRSTDGGNFADLQKNGAQRPGCRLVGGEDGQRRSFEPTDHLGQKRTITMQFHNQICEGQNVCQSERGFV